MDRGGAETVEDAFGLGLGFCAAAGAAGFGPGAGRAGFLGTDCARGVGETLLPVDVVRHRRAHRRDAGVRAVAETERLDRLGGDPLQRLLRRCGRRHVRIAEREVADGLRAVLRLELKPLLEHLADPGRSRHGLLYLIGYQLHFDTTFPSIDSVYCITRV